MALDTVEEIEHTADWSLRVRGLDLPDLFANAVRGMVELIGVNPASPVSEVRPITLQAADTETLLVTWLEELLFILESEDKLPSASQVVMPSNTQLLATITLVPAGERTKEIKAVTYHELEVIETALGYEVTIVFDV